MFVLTNAVSLRADWQQPFDPGDTNPGEFTRPDGSTDKVPMVDQEGEFRLLRRSDEEAEGGVGYRAVELPYVGGNVSMVLVVPSRDRSLADLVEVVDAGWLESRFAEFDRCGPDRAQVEMPRFTFGNDFVLNHRFKALGMTTAFDPDRADFRRRFLRATERIPESNDFVTVVVSLLAGLVVLYSLLVAHQLLLGAIAALLLVVTYVSWRYLRKVERGKPQT